ncbi:MAG: TolC family protein [Bacteroidales bacterium]|nr:TolC family protein [Bacteroidales bacterium]
MPARNNNVSFSIYLLLVVSILFKLSLPKAIAQDTPFLKLSLQMAVDMALENNLQIKNSLLEIEKSKLALNGSIDILPANFVYQYGNIHTPLNDRYLALNQNFGSLLTHIRKYKEAKSELSLEQSRFELAEKEIIAEVKSAYFFWLLLNQKSEVLHELKDRYANLGHIANLKYETGDIDLLEKTTLLAMQAKAETEYNTLLYDLIISRNKLKQLIITDAEIVPEVSGPDLYMIDKAAPDSDYHGRTVLNIYEKYYEVEKNRLKTEKAAFFPEISAGYFNQAIGTLKGLNGWQAGLSFPLWFISPVSEVKQAKINTLIALNNLENQKFIIQNTIENLLFELNKHFKQVIYYKEFILPQAEQLIKTAELQFDKEEIEYPDYLQGISMGYKLFTDYYETVNNYNQTAIQLEFYAD